MPSPEARSRSDILARSIDEKGTFFQFGYQLCVLEMAAEPAPGMPRAPSMSIIDIGRILTELSKTASRSNLLEPLCQEISDISALLDQRSKEDSGLSPELRRLVSGSARRWLRRVKALPNRSNALAMDIFFNIELAGLTKFTGTPRASARGGMENGELRETPPPTGGGGIVDIASDLFEAAVCLEHGAYRASGMMSVAAMEKALREAGAAGEGSLEFLLEWARRSGRLTAADQRCALASLGPGRSGDWDGLSSEGALATAVRLVKKALRGEIEKALLEAAEKFRGERSGGPHPVEGPPPPKTDKAANRFSCP